MTDDRIRISVADPGLDGRLHAPAAARNADAIAGMLLRYAPKQGHALELASGTGQHVTQFAQSMPDLMWQPSEVDAERLDSISVWLKAASLKNVKDPIHLDATQPGWHVTVGPQSLILLVNLLHLVPENAARTAIAEAAKGLAPDGRFIFYGPFLRDGLPTSDGDRRFNAALQARADGMGYKNDTDVIAWVQAAGLEIRAMEDMPANNLLFVAQKSSE